MMAITTSSSINVKPLFRISFSPLLGLVDEYGKQNLRVGSLLKVLDNANATLAIGGSTLYIREAIMGSGVGWKSTGSLGS